MLRKLAAIWCSGFVLLVLVSTIESFSIYGRDQDDANDEMETNNGIQFLVKELSLHSSTFKFVTLEMFKFKCSLKKLILLSQ